MSCSDGNWHTMNIPKYKEIGQSLGYITILIAHIYIYVCGVCQIINETQTFSNKEGDRTYEIRSDSLDCNSGNVVYLVQCKTCNMQYVGSASTKFRLRLNNYKYCLRKYEEQQSVPQMSFHAHFASGGS